LAGGVSFIRDTPSRLDRASREKSLEHRQEKQGIWPKAAGLASVGCAGAALVFLLAQMHQSHDQEISKKVAALAVGKHYQRFPELARIRRDWNRAQISRWGR
jgi:hypothetical protein